MGRIPNEEIERLKREISLERLVEARGVKLAKRGADLIGLCPLHDDHDPSLVVDVEKNLWHCLGACQAGGSVIDWVMRSEGVSFRHAVELLRNGAPLASTPRSGPPPKQSRVKKLAPFVDRNADEMELLGAVVDVYHATLKESPEALAYLQARGLVHPEVIERFRLGYANRTLGYRLPEKSRKEGAEIRGRLVEVGVYRMTGHEHLAGSLVIPLFDGDGRVVNLYGRKVRDDLRPGTPMHLYLPGGHRGVFNREAFGASEELVLCEALIDALTFWCAGYRNVTTAYGIEGFTEELADAIAEAGVRVVKIAFDRDEAGDRGAAKVSEKLGAMGIETYRVLFPRGMDANAYALKVGPAEKSLGLVLRQAEWMSRGATRGKTTAAESMPHEESEPPAASLPEETTTPEAHAASAPPRAPTIPPLAASSLSSSVETPRQASPAATSPHGEPAASVKREEKGDDLIFRFGDRKWRVRWLSKEGARGEMKVNLLVAREGERGGGFFVDTVELYAARQRAAFQKAAAVELEMDERVLAREVGQILLELEERRDAKIEEALAPTPATPAMTDAEREEALALLRDPKLLERVLSDLERAGIVGEETNKLVSYLATTSRKLDEPLAVVIQSSSAAGKSSLMDSILSLVPEEERVQYSAMTGQSLFYMGGQSLKHKVLAIVEEEGAERASYALKLLQSEGELTIASAGKDPATGKHITHEYRVEGPVMIFLTTTAIEVDEELLNRCIVLTVDEGREQTRAIHERQRRGRTLEGQLEAEERKRIRRTHRNAQRLLRPVRVVNPFAESLRFPDHTTRTRRDHMKYLTLISAVALLHQYQRPLRTTTYRGEKIDYIEATEEDIAIATKLAHGVLGRSLDELPPQTRRLLHELETMVGTRMEREGVEREHVRFTRREVREWTRMGNTQLKLHMGRLEELEYLWVHRMRGPLVEYELRYGGEGKSGEPFVIGLTYDGDRSRCLGDRSAPGRGLVGPKSAGGRDRENGERSGKTALNGAHANGVSKLL